MMRPRVLPRSVWLVAALLGVALAVSACGRGAEPTETPAAVEPTATTAAFAQASTATAVPQATATAVLPTEAATMAAVDPEVVAPADTPAPATDTPAPTDAPAVVATVGQTAEGLYFTGSPDPAALTVTDYSDFL